MIIQNKNFAAEPIKIEGGSGLNPKEKGTAIGTTKVLPTLGTQIPEGTPATRVTHDEVLREDEIIGKRKYKGRIVNIIPKKVSALRF